MPLSPAEVHNVAFKKPPIGKRGYDEEEVDAFLDVVEVELARLIEENNDLRGRSNGASPVAAAADDAAGPDGADSAAANAELASVREENQRMQGHVAELERALSQGNDGVQAQVVQLQQQLSQTEQRLSESRRELEAAQQSLTAAQQQPQAAAPDGAAAAPPVSADHHIQAVQVLAMAQQTADQHMAQVKGEAERLLADAKNNAQTMVSDAKALSSKNVGDSEARAKQLQEESTARATRTVQDAEQRAATITAQFEQRKAALERRVEELRTFEREYRTRLKSYLESQLRDLDASGKAEPAQTGELAEAQQS